MTKQEFIESVMFKPWVDRACGPDSYDCWGLVVAYYRDVLNIELKIYLDGDIQDGYLKEIESENWKESENGIVFMCFKNGKPAHCGIIVGGKCLHAAGWEGAGQVTIMTKHKMNRIFRDMRLYEYVAS